MPRAMRVRVERDLRSYRAKSVALANVADEEAVLLAAPSAHVSQIGSQRMRPSDPTPTRAIHLADLYRRHGLNSQTALMVRSVERWLTTLGAADLLIVRMTYRMASSDRWTAEEVAAQAGVGTRELRRRLNGLLWEAAAALGHLRARSEMTRRDAG